MDFAGARQRLVDWTKTRLFGPGDSRDFKLTGVRPSELFQTGVLFPVAETGVDPAAASEDTDMQADLAVDSASDADVDEEVAAKLIRYVPPSSVGFSFFVEGEDAAFEITCRAVRYEASRLKGKVTWNRVPCTDRDGFGWGVHLHAAQRHLQVIDYQDIFAGSADDSSQLPASRAKLMIVSRPHGEGRIVTVSLSNTQPLTSVVKDARLWVEQRETLCLFECALECRVISGRVGDYPRVPSHLLTAEEQELSVQYRRQRVLAVGHGAAADWRDKDGATVISAEFMPQVEVPQVTADTIEDATSVLDVDFLAGAERNRPVVISALRSFVDEYANWVDGQVAQAGALDGQDYSAAGRIVGRMQRAVARMHAGIDRMSGNGAVALRAFAFANRAMALQMRKSRDLAGQAPRAPRWRPFQLGFLLAAMQSAIDEDTLDRDLVDLIWFPTGGGKTEAYLALVALVVAWRRWTFPLNGGGTTVLMRYTLRLLTAQQFERATRLIFAMEHLRRTESGLGLGNEPISVGLWVGGDTTPNTCTAFAEKVKQAVARGEPAPVVLVRCPWCGTDFGPNSYATGINQSGFRCRNLECEFVAGIRGSLLPCNVVDEMLYKEPPTLLVATIDKFARFAWEPRTIELVGGPDRSRRPPDLIVQDELHLIAGPLGSIAGVYEAALDTIIRARGVRPKYVASTATICNAAEQVKALYAREPAIFPPPGLDHADSWFARTVPTSVRPGRLYVGYLAPGRQPAKAIAPLAACLLTAPLELFDQDVDRDDLLDAWWTLVSYHSSLRGVGQTYGVLSEDARQHLGLLRMLERAENQLPGTERRRSPGTRWPNVKDRYRMQALTSLVDARTNQETFERLTRVGSAPSALDIVVATNMISVGVDVVRLALMIVNGQPLTTAEYIQASSRVGRDRVPGLVFANYYRNKARSLSHYEDFRAYHDALYRHVEPTSVTPFSYPSRKKSLHAALIIVMRHAAGLISERDAGRFDAEDLAQQVCIDQLATRCANADKGRRDAIREHLLRLQGEWTALIENCRLEHIALQYSANQGTGKGVVRLISDHDAKLPGLWRTLQSMRDVEHTALVELEP